MAYLWHVSGNDRRLDVRLSCHVQLLLGAGHGMGQCAIQLTSELEDGVPDKSTTAEQVGQVNKIYRLGTRLE